MTKMIRLMAVAAFAALATVGTSAQALEPCGQVVVDTAAALKNASAVEAAAASLARETGAEVRVRIAPDHAPQSNLDRHVEAIADSVCDAWTNQDGARRSNMLIFWVTMNPQVGLYYGDLWETELDRAWPNILERRVKPLLRDGNFDQAFIAGMQETARVIKAASQPAQPIVVERIEREVVRVEQREPTDYRPFLVVLSSIIASMIFAFIVIRYLVLPGWQLFERNRGMREEARGVLAKCYQTFEHLNNFSGRLMQVLDEKGAPKEAPDWSTNAQFAAWHHHLVRLMQQAAAANTAFLTLESGPLREAGTYEEYRENRDSLMTTLDELSEVATQLAALEDAIKEQEVLSNQIQSLAQAVEEADRELKRAMLVATEEGFKIDFVDQGVQNAARLQAEATQKRALKQFRDATALYHDAIAEFAGLRQAVVGIAKRRDDLRASWQTLTARRHELSDRLPVMRTVMALIEERYAPSTYETVIGNGSEAEKRLNAVPAMAQAINGLLETQSWDQAQAALDSAHNVLNDATELLESIPALSSQLETAERDAKEELEEAERSIQVAQDFLRQNNEYVTAEGNRQLKEAQTLCLHVRAVLEGSKPDVLQAYAEAARADDLADDVFNTASGKKEQAERQKRRAERERREALAALETAERYFRNHRSDISSAAKSSLSSTERLAQRLREERDAAMVIQLVQQLNTTREKAYRQAKADFSSAEQKRRRAAARRRVSQSSTSFGGGSSSWGSSSSSSSFGGGSSGFGSGGSGFGGGSSSW